jgi:hypothetical protein
MSAYEDDADRFAAHVASECDDPFCQVCIEKEELEVKQMTSLAVAKSTVEQLELCPLGCGSKRAGIQDGSVFFGCGTSVDMAGEKPAVRRAEGCIEVVTSGRRKPK